MEKNYFQMRQNCPICKASKLKELYATPYSNPKLINYLKAFYEPQGFIDLQYLAKGNYVLMKCEHCSLIFQKEAPNHILLEQIYEKWIDPDLAFKRSRALGLNERLIYLNEILDVLNYLNKPPFETNLFDFGMGWGNYSILAKSLGVKVFGSELSQKRVKNAIDNGVTVINWDAIKNYQFDYINADNVFEHLVEPKEVLDYLKNALAKGGVFKISVPNGLVAKNAIKLMDWENEIGIKNNLNAVSPLEHINCFFPISLIELAKSCGLKETKIMPKRSIRVNKESSISKIKTIYRQRVLGLKPLTVFFTRA